jgi:predicted GIY-YIG superfamily endonuclease
MSASFNPSPHCVWLWIGLFLALPCPFIEATQSNSNDTATVKSSLPPELIRQAFRNTHDGWSVDEVLLEDGRRQRFLEQAYRLTACEDEQEVLEALIQLRKSGNLQVRTSRRSHEDVSDAIPAGEIAARRMQDEHQALIDQILVNPERRAQFDQLGLSIMPNETPYRLRKAALRLRKTRELTPELTLRVADWKRNIVEMSVEEARQDLARIPKQAGIYLFLDATGYLYIGQSNNLRERLGKHLLDSDRKSLTQYLSEHSEQPIRLELHVFESSSPAQETRIREAYESELIRSRKPRLNIAP